MKLRRPKKFFCNQGVAIVQLLASAAIMATIIYGIISMLMYSAGQQRKQNMQANLSEMQNRIKGLLNDPGSWQNTFKAAANATSFSCITSGCAAGSRNMIIEIRDSSNVIMLSNLPGDWSVPTYPVGGFTERGLACAGFNGNVGSGNDACPFTYKIVWEPVVTMSNPAFRLTARLLYNPGTTFTKTVIQLGSDIALSAIDSANIGKRPTIPTAFTGNLNQVLDSTTGKYDITVWRTVTSNVPTFRAVSQISGVCPVGVPMPRGGWSTALANGGYDPYNLTAIQGSKTIRIATIGTYDCEIVGTANGIGSFTVVLTRIPGAPIAASPPVPAIPSGPMLQAASSSGFAADGRQATAQFNLSFQHLNVNDRYQVEQSCNTNTAPAPSAPNEALGLPSAGVVLASISCRLIHPN